MGFGGTPMLRLLYKHNEQRLDGPGGTWGPPLRSGHSSISRKAVGRPMKGLLLNARPIRVRNPVDLDNLVFGVYLGSHAAPDASEVAHRARRVRALGAASLDLCLVARGASDLYYMHSSIVDAKLRAVDIAGAVLIVREAGGLVLDLKKKELDMALTSTARTDLVAVGDRRTLEVLP